MKVLVSGANGFVGRALCSHLDTHRHAVVPAVRRASGLAGEVIVGDIDDATDWTAALTACDAVVHLAARVHVMDDPAHNPLALYRATNTEATLNLARQAARAGVKRFVFISSIKVNGEGRVCDLQMGCRTGLATDCSGYRAGSRHPAPAAGVWARGEGEFPAADADGSTGLDLSGFRW